MTRTPLDGVAIRTARRAMHALEKAGLIKIVRKPGSGLDVTILDTQGDEDTDGTCPP